MINLEGMLVLTRRMTPSRTCFQRIAGCARVDAIAIFNRDAAKTQMEIIKHLPGGKGAE